MRLMLIGGGDVGRGNTTYETKIIDEEIVKMTEKDQPNFLFIGLASKFSDSYYDTMKKIYKQLGCECAYLKKKNILNNPDIVKNKIKTADIIYFCGGDTIKLINDLKGYQIDKLLSEAINENTVIAGMSAGAIMLSKKGYSDALKLRDESDKYEFIEGLNYIDLTLCPHYHNDKRKELKADLKGSKQKVIALENGTALKAVDTNISVITSIDNAKAYFCHYEENKFNEHNITNKNISIDDLK